MRCDICNKLLAEPTYNVFHCKWEPCSECQEAIEDTLAAFRDRPSIDEDEPGISQEQLPLPFKDGVDFT